MNFQESEASRKKHRMMPGLHLIQQWFEKAKMWWSWELNMTLSWVYSLWRLTTAANPAIQSTAYTLRPPSNNKHKSAVVVNSEKWIVEKGSWKKKYMWTWEEGQFKRQVAMQMINKHDSPSSRLINRATSGIGHKWSMNLRMDWECVSVFEKPDRSSAGHHSLSCDEGVSEFVPTALIQTIQRTAVNSTTESQQSFISMPRDLYRKSTKMYECSKKSEGGKKTQKKPNPKYDYFFCFS